MLADMTHRRTLAALTLATLALSACGGGGGSAGGGATQAAGGEKLDVVVGFYPLQYAAERIGGDKVEVTNLTKPGAHAHDSELSPKDVALVSEADLAIYEKAIQPAVEAAVTSQNVTSKIEVDELAKLDAVVDQPIIDVADEHAGHDHAGHDHAAETADPHATETPDEHATESADEHAGHDHEHEAEAGGIDPHFWLDPIRYRGVAEAIAAKLGEIDPANKATYDANLASLRTDLTALDSEYSAGLKTCSNTKLVTSHAAFGYLAKRYGFTQAAISGLSPEEEPEPQRLAAVADYAKANNVKAIYSETLSSPAVAETVARETGAKVMVLDPIEGLTQEGTDYLSVMRTNLSTLKTGQSCS